MRETELKSKLAKELRTEHNCEAICLGGSVFQMAGLPDILVIKNGIYIWIECKGKDTPIEPLQLKTHERLRKHGAIVHVLRFVDTKEWVLSDLFHIRFKKFSEGVAELMRVLTQVVERQPTQLST